MWIVKRKPLITKSILYGISLKPLLWDVILNYSLTTRADIKICCSFHLAWLLCYSSCHTRIGSQRVFIFNSPNFETIRGSEYSLIFPKTATFSLSKMNQNSLCCIFYNIILEYESSLEVQSINYFCYW